MKISRRGLLKAGIATYMTSISGPSLFASAVQSFFAEDKAVNSLRLEKDWQFYQGPLAPGQVWHSQEIVRWESVTLPHCFNHYDACDPDTPAYRGPGWYRTQLSIENPFPKGRTLLQFQGAGQNTEVFVDNVQVGKHVGGYDEFLFDITQASKTSKTRGKVDVSILCDNSRDPQRLPSDLSDFTLYGGVYRPLALVYVPAVSFEAVHTNVRYELGGPAQVLVTARLYAPDAIEGSIPLELVVYDPSGQKLIEKKVEKLVWSGETTLFDFELPKPELWSPDTPNLYRCEVSLQSSDGIAKNVHHFGVRHLRFEEHGPFYLNGERLLLRGTQRHEDHAGYAAAMPDDLIRKELQMVKDMGANFIRLGHYQQSRLVLELCDQLGIFVWEELPWCRSGVGDKTFQELGRAQLRAMIDQHRNHPSVLLWGLGNEDDWPEELNGEDHEQIRRYMKELNDLSHSLDPSRFTSYRRCDSARDIPDVYSPSIWAGWYSGRYTDYRESLEKARYTVPHFLHIEWGADSHAGRHSEDQDPALDRVLGSRDTAEKGLAYKLSGGPARMSRDGEWSETYACDLFDWYLKTTEETPWLAGTAQWIFKDFTTPLRVENPVPRVNQKGLLTRDMTPKESYYLFQSYWAKKPMVHIYGHTWPMRWGKAGQERLVRVYSNQREVELYLNGRSVGVKQRNAQDFPAAGLRWNLAFRDGENELRAISKCSSGVIEDRVTFQYETRAWKEPAKLSLSVKKRETAISTVEVVLSDKNGVRCLNARNLVRFSLAGPGRLIDNLGTPDGSRVVQLYNGRAEIKVEHRSVVMVGVASENLESVYTKLDV